MKNHNKTLKSLNEIPGFSEQVEHYKKYPEQLENLVKSVKIPEKYWTKVKELHEQLCPITDKKHNFLSCLIEKASKVNEISGGSGKAYIGPLSVIIVGILGIIFYNKKYKKRWILLGSIGILLTGLGYLVYVMKNNPTSILRYYFDKYKYSMMSDKEIFEYGKKFIRENNDGDGSIQYMNINDKAFKNRVKDISLGVIREQLRLYPITGLMGANVDTQIENFQYFGEEGYVFKNMIVEMFKRDMTTKNRAQYKYLTNEKLIDFIVENRMHKSILLNDDELLRQVEIVNRKTIEKWLADHKYKTPAKVIEYCEKIYGQPNYAKNVIIAIIDTANYEAWRPPVRAEKKKVASSINPPPSPQINIQEEKEKKDEISSVVARDLTPDEQKLLDAFRTNTANAVKQSGAWSSENVDNNTIATHFVEGYEQMLQSDKSLLENGSLLANLFGNLYQSHKIMDLVKDIGSDNIPYISYYYLTKTKQNLPALKKIFAKSPLVREIIESSNQTMQDFLQPPNMPGFPLRRTGGNSTSNALHIVFVILIVLVLILFCFVVFHNKLGIFTLKLPTYI